MGRVSKEMMQGKEGGSHLRFQCIAKSRNVDERHNVDGKLSEDRTDDVDVEDVGLGTLLAQTLDDLRARDAQEAYRHEQPTNGVLRVAKLDTLEVEHGQRVGADETVEGENLVHLDRGDERAPALADDVGDGNDVAQLGREGRSDGGVAELQGRGLVVAQLRLHHARGELVGEAGGLLGHLLLALGAGVGDGVAVVGGGLGCRSDSCVGRVAEGLDVLLGGDVLLLGLALNSLHVVGVVGTGRVQVGNDDRHRRCWLVEASHELALLDVHLLHLGVARVVGDADEVVLGTVEKGDTDVRLLEGTHIVGTVTGHERVVSHILETKKNVLLLLRRDTRVDPCVAEESFPGDLILELGKGVTGDTDILGLENLRVDGLSRIHVNADLVVDAPPDELVAVIVVLGRVENENVTVDDLNLACDVYSSKRVVSGNHDDTVAALVEHLDSLLGVLLERAVQNEESGKGEISLDLFTLEIVDLAGAEFRVDSKLLVGQSENTGSLAGEILVRLLVIGGNVDQHLHDGLGRTLDSGKRSLELLTGSGVGAVDHGDGALALESRGELEAALDLDGAVGTTSLVGALKGVIFANGPSERGESGLFHGVSDNVAFVKPDQGVSSSKNQLSLQASSLDRSDIRVSSVGLLLVVHLLMSESETSNTLDDEILAGECASLVKAGNVDATSKRDTERLSAEDGKLGEGCKTGVDGKTQLHGELGRDDTGNNQDAVKQELGALAILANTLVPNVPGGRDGEDKEEENEEESLNITSTNALGRVDHGSHKTALRRLESSLHHNGHGTVVRGSRDTGC